MLYLGWAAAGLDPDGIGRDPMWTLDGQMRFSLFPFIARRLIAASSIDFAGMSLALLGVILWACGLIALVRALGEQRSLAAIMIACAAFPAEYGLGFIFFGEPLATPRVFAESATLFSLAALVRGRQIVAGAIFILGVAVHPIMALTGVATAFAYLCFENKRWLWLAAVGAAFGVAGALLGVPMLNWLTQRIDPQWLELLHNRDTLFVT